MTTKPKSVLAWAAVTTTGIYLNSVRHTSGEVATWILFANDIDRTAEPIPVRITVVRERKVWKKKATKRRAKR